MRGLKKVSSGLLRSWQVGHISFFFNLPINCTNTDLFLSSCHLVDRIVHNKLCISKNHIYNRIYCTSRILYSARGESLINSKSLVRVRSKLAFYTTFLLEKILQKNKKYIYTFFFILVIYMIII